MYLPTDSIIHSVFKKSFPIRHDGTPYLRYPSPRKHGVNVEDFSFLSGKYRLYGSRVFLKKGEYKGLVYFAHGATAGRDAYGHLIAEIAKKGYLVYSFDYTGCMQSGGIDCNGMGQPLLDIDFFFRFLDQDEEAKGLKRYVIGHSWGGYVSMACLQDKYRVEKIINISGFDSVENVALCAVKSNSSFFRLLLRHYAKHKYGKIGLYNGLEAMKKTDKEVLVIFGEDDTTVPYDYFYKRYEREASSNPHVHFLSVPGLGHQPYWSKRAQRYYLEVVRGPVLFQDGKDPDALIDYGILFEYEPSTLKAMFDFLEA